MAYNPKKQVQRILWAMKKSASRVRTASDKKKYIEAKAKKMDANPTGLEYAFIELLNELKIKFETQKILQGKIYDFFIPEKNTIIEVDGDYWHGYNIPLNEMNHIQKKAYYNDKRKDTIAKGLGYNLIRIWEHELDDEHYLETKEKMRDLLR